MNIASIPIFSGRIFGTYTMDNMAIGDIQSVPETAYGFRTKLLLFIHRIEKLREALHVEKGEIEILDVGCGNGIQMTFPLGAQGYSVLGIDSHEESLIFAREKNPFPEVRFLKGDTQHLYSLAFEKKIHVIILSDILEHVEHPEKLLHDCANFLHPSGIILVSIPNGRGPFEIENFILRKTGVLRLGYAIRNALQKNPTEIPYNHESGHIQFFNRSRFQKLIGNADLKITHFETGSFLCGSVTARIIGRFRPLTHLNLAIGRRLPSALSSVWYFELTKK